MCIRDSGAAIRERQERAALHGTAPRPLEIVVSGRAPSIFARLADRLFPDHGDALRYLEHGRC